MASSYLQYQPLPMDLSFLPKELLDVAPVSVEDAYKGYQQLTAQDLANQINQEKVDQIKQQTAEQDALKKIFQARDDGTVPKLSDVKNQVGDVFNQQGDINNTLALQKALGDQSIQQGQLTAQKDQDIASKLASVKAAHEYGGDAVAHPLYDSYGLNAIAPYDSSIISAPQIKEIPYGGGAISINQDGTVKTVMQPQAREQQFNKILYDNNDNAVSVTNKEEEAKALAAGYTRTKTKSANEKLADQFSQDSSSSSSGPGVIDKLLSSATNGLKSVAGQTGQSSAAAPKGVAGDSAPTVIMRTVVPKRMVIPRKK